MITVSNLVFRHPGSTFTLEVPALSVASGEKVALAGPSGSGKTTLLNLIAGILVGEGGMVSVDGIDPATLGDAARRAFRIARIGMVFQDFQLIDYLDVLENILLPYRINPALRLDAGVRERARQLARETGIDHRLDHRPERLSHGERQRVALCRAMIARPRILLADEPTGNLDPAAKSSVLDVLFEQCRRSQACLLMVTHDVALLDRFDRRHHLAEVPR